ncbi:4Fe-4S dicluster domain-containing protein [Chlorobium sp.]|uniref:4Fe-4S dicluster domain-containing protein n=1 Tax=Chlorobium sp. TaxID=1095 RepID=UPI003C35E557
MLVFDCFFGRCEKPSCDGCLFMPVRSLRLRLKSRAMQQCEDDSVDTDGVWKKEVESVLAARVPETKLPSAKRKKRLLAPREEIAWFPTIKADLCNGCADCKVLCRPGVFEPGPPDPEGIHRPKFLVAHPYKCLVLCDRCVPICTSGAIKLPPKEDFEKYIEYVD